MHYPSKLSEDAMEYGLLMVTGFSKEPAAELRNLLRFYHNGLNILYREIPVFVHIHISIKVNIKLHG